MFDKPYLYPPPPPPLPESKPDPKVDKQRMVNYENTEKKKIRIRNGTIKNKKKLAPTTYITHIRAHRPFGYLEGNQNDFCLIRSYIRDLAPIQ